jgi:hypothetical protein
VRFGLLLTCAAVVLAGCGNADGPERGSPSTGATTAGTTTAAPDPVVEGAESCPALADYLAQGGSSDDDTYDAATDTLIVYAVDSRTFVLTPRDASCISGSAAVSERVRDAVEAGGTNTPGSGESTMFKAALKAGVRVAVRSHCGVNGVTIDGRLWLADPPLGDHNPPPGWDENATSGYFFSKRKYGSFYGDQGQRATFRSAADDAEDPDLGCE